MSEEALWSHLWSVARYDLGLPEEDFWPLTPRKLDALLSRHQDAQKREEILLAALRCDIINFSFSHPKEPIQVKDLVRLPRKERTGGRPRRINQKNREEIANSLRRLFAGTAEPSC